MNVTCTIITANYLHYALALNKSLVQFQTIPLYILLVGTEIDESPIKEIFPNVHFLYLDDVQHIPNAKAIIMKYQEIDNNALRWSLKSVLANYLLGQYDKVVVLDADLFFYQDFQFLFDDLENSNVLLTPHWRNSNPFLNEGKENEHFEHLFVAGLFNAGFIGVNKQAINVLNWWAECCLYRCDLRIEQGHYGDQTYLNLIPIYFDNVKILKHKGCNLSEWNYVECKRILQKDGTLLINNTYPIVFIHYASCFIEDIERGKDNLLTSYLDNWKKITDNYRVYSIQKQKEEIQNLTILVEEEKVGFLVKLKRKIRIRTRIRRFITG